MSSSSVPVACLKIAYSDAANRVVNGKMRVKVVRNRVKVTTHCVSNILVASVPATKVVMHSRCVMTDGRKRRLVLLVYMRRHNVDVEIDARFVVFLESRVGCSTTVSGTLGSGKASV